MSDRLHKEILLCSTPRSGSTVLAEAMFRTGRMGYPDEFFNNNQQNKGDFARTIFEHNYGKLGAESYEDYLAKLVAAYSSENGVHSVKMHFQHFHQALAAGYFQHPANRFYVFIYRENVAAQAASLAIAIKTQKWNSTMKGNQDKDVVVPDELLAKAYQALVFDNLKWQAYFRMFDVPHVSMEYETFTTDIRGAVAEIADHADIEIDPSSLDELASSLRLTKQSRELNTQLEDRLKGMTLDRYAAGNILFDTKVLYR